MKVRRKEEGAESFPHLPIGDDYEDMMLPAILVHCSHGCFNYWGEGRGPCEQKYVFGLQGFGREEKAPKANERMTRGTCKADVRCDFSISV